MRIDKITFDTYYRFIINNVNILSYSDIEDFYNYLSYMKDKIINKKFDICFGLTNQK